jgi:hypothetical protein
VRTRCTHPAMLALQAQLRPRALLLFVAVVTFLVCRCALSIALFQCMFVALCMLLWQHTLVTGAALLAYFAFFAYTKVLNRMHSGAQRCTGLPG